MKRLSDSVGVRLSVLVCGLLCFAWQSGAAVPATLDSWAQHAQTRVGSAEEVGRIASSEASAVIRVVVLENPLTPAELIRGVRIELENDGVAEQIYVDETDLVYRKDELDRMRCSIVNARQHSGPRSIIGTERCRPSQPKPQVYCPAYTVEPGFEGLVLSTRAGIRFRFPSTQPMQLAGLFGEAMKRLGIQDRLPPAEPISLPAEDLNKIVIAAIEHFPQLASSPGVKAAGYQDPYEQDSAWVIFQPFERSGNLGRSLMVFCDAAANSERDWRCIHGKAREYLTISGQERPVVISGQLGGESAIAAVELAQQQLLREATTPGSDFRISMIHVPCSSGGALRVIANDGEFRSVTMHVAGSSATGFEITEISRYDTRTCGE